MESCVFKEIRIKFFPHPEEEIYNVDVSLIFKCHYI
jgi:hypothetical protein